MLRKRQKIATLVVTTFALTLCSLVSSAALAVETKGVHAETVIDVPREHRIVLDMPYEKAAIIGVESHNEPKENDVAEAAAKDPKDKTFVLMRFFYKNADYVKHRARIQAILLGEGDVVLGEGNRKGTLDPQQVEDTITFHVRVKTVDWAKAQKMKVLVTFLD